MLVERWVSYAGKHRSVLYSLGNDGSMTWTTISFCGTVLRLVALLLLFVLLVARAATVYCSTRRMLSPVLAHRRYSYMFASIASSLHCSGQDAHAWCGGDGNDAGHAPPEMLKIDGRPGLWLGMAMQKRPVAGRYGDGPPMTSIAHLAASGTCAGSLVNISYRDKFGIGKRP